MALFEVRDVTVRYGGVTALRNATVTAEPRGIHGLIGPNGAGKSTLFNLITAKYPVTSGRIRLKGEDVTRLRPYQINRRGLSRSFQVTNIFPRLSVFENLRCGVLWSLGYRYSCWHFVNGLRDVQERTEAVLEQIHLTARRDVR